MVNSVNFADDCKVNSVNSWVQARAARWWEYCPRPVGALRSARGTGAVEGPADPYASSSSAEASGVAARACSRRRFSHSRRSLKRLSLPSSVGL